MGSLVGTEEPWSCIQVMPTPRSRSTRHGERHTSVRVLGFCLIPNHVHLVMHQAAAAAPSGFMQWWMTSHARRYHRHYPGVLSL
ncbi:MAG: hypothetical protein D6690_14315 [Nitrospirae bacterium]|nr:MAG: hypothetical protein D6690_14315 [Nitrospirota bacterium]